MVSNFFMLKTIATKFAILCLCMNLLLLISQRIHCNYLREYVSHEFFMLFQMTEEDIITFGPMYVKMTLVN